MEPFDVNLDDPQGTSLTPTFQPAPADVGLLPNTAPVMGPPPQMPVLPPPPRPPNVQQDPKMQLAALIALGTALGQGPQGGGAGAIHGFLRAAEQQQGLGEQRYRMQQQEYLRQQQIAAEQQRQATAIYNQREMALQRALANFKTQTEKVADKQEYDALAEAYGNSLRAAGYRTISPDWLRANIPYMQPSEGKTATKAFDDWLKNPSNAKLLNENPDAVFKSMVEVDLNGDGIKERMPLPVLAEKAGKPFAQVDGQYITAPRGIAGNSTFDVIANAKLATFRAENRRDPTPKEKEQILSDAVAATKEKTDAATNPLDEEYKRLRNQKLRNDIGQGGPGGGANGGALTDQGLDYAATQYRVTGVMPPMGMGKTPDRARIINRAAEQAKGLSQTPAQAIQKQAAYKADSAALTKMRTMSSAAESFETKALSQADIVADLSQKVNRTQWPIVNQAVISGKVNLLGDSNAQQLVNAITTFSTEYAKIMEGSTGSVAASSDSARKAAERLINARLNKGTLRDTLELMKREMRLTIQGYDATIAHITERMGGAAPTATPQAPNPGRFTIIPKGGQ